MKKFLFALAFLITGCVSTGLKTVEAKFAPGDCLRLTPETVRREFVGSEADGQALVLYVVAVGKDVYVASQHMLDLTVGTPSLFSSKQLNNDTMEIECPKYLQKKEPN